MLPFLNIFAGMLQRSYKSAKNIAELVEASKDQRVDMSQVTCPMLMLVGEGEFQNEECKRQHQNTLEHLPNPVKKLVVAPHNEGASGHCLVSNHSLMSQITFDWPDQVFAEHCLTRKEA